MAEKKDNMDTPKRETVVGILDSDNGSWKTVVIVIGVLFLILFLIWGIAKFNTQCSPSEQQKSAIYNCKNELPILYNSCEKCVDTLAKKIDKKKLDSLILYNLHFYPLQSFGIK
jgi:hypothetical protein